MDRFDFDLACQSQNFLGSENVRSFENRVRIREVNERSIVIDDIELTCHLLKLLLGKT